MYMRILLVGDRKQPPVETIVRLLESKGHEVGVYTPRQPQASTLGHIRNSLGRGRDVAVLRAMIGKWKPDCVHVADNRNYPSQSLCAIARQSNIPTIWSANDYSPLCPAGSCRTPEGEVCEECMHGARRIMVRRCMERKALPSFIGLIDTLYWDVARLSRVADTITVTSEFMRSKWLEAGFPSQRVETLPLPWENTRIDRQERKEFFCFTGDLTPESGVETLVRAAVATDVPLVVAGQGILRERLANLAAHSPLIKLMDMADDTLIARAKAVVVPSESYIHGEQLAKEALCAGTPVIASAIAGLPEMVGEHDGVTFTAGNTEELAAVLREFDKRHAFSHGEIARRNTDKYSEDRFYNKLMQLYLRF